MDEKGDVNSTRPQITPLHQHEKPVGEADDSFLPGRVVVPLLFKDILLERRPHILQGKPCHVDQWQEVEEGDEERDNQKLHVVHLVERAKAASE